MNARVKDKIKDLEKYLEELESIRAQTFEEYEKDKKTKAACERYVERIIEAAVDLAFLVVKEKRLHVPEEDTKAFDVLANAKIISKELSEKLQRAKGMRNVIAHLYGEVDDEIVFNSISDQLQDDVKALI